MKKDTPQEEKSVFRRLKQSIKRKQRLKLLKQQKVQNINAAETKKRER